jgi:hypothetical protein
MHPGGFFALSTDDRMHRCLALAVIAFRSFCLTGERGFILLARRWICFI